MGISGISPASLILIFLILFLVFGKNRIKELAEELGSAVKVFKKSLDEDKSSNTSSVEGNKNVTDSVEQNNSDNTKS